MIIRKKTFISTLLTVVVSAVCIIPEFGESIGNTLLLSLFVVWILSWFLFAPAKSVVYSPLFLLPSLLFLYQFLLCALGISTVYMKTVILRITLYYIPLFAELAIKYFRREELQAVSTSVFVVYFGSIFFRVMNAVGGNGEEEVLSNFSTINVLMITMSILIFAYVLMENKKEKAFRRLLLWAALIMSIYYVIFINYRAIALSLLAFSLMLMLYIKLFPRNKTRAVIFCIVITAVALVILNNMDAILESISKIVPDTDAKGKIEDMRSLLDGGEGVSYRSMNQRFRFYAISINTYISSPLHVLFGIGEQYFPTSNFYYAQTTGVGGHSQVFDMLAQCGLFGFILAVTWFKNIYKLQTSCAENKQKKKLVGAVWVFLVLYSILNNLFERTFFCIAFLYFPIMLAIMKSDVSAE